MVLLPRQDRHPPGSPEDRRSPDSARGLRNLDSAEIFRNTKKMPQTPSAAFSFRTVLLFPYGFGFTISNSSNTPSSYLNFKIQQFPRRPLGCTSLVCSQYLINCLQEAPWDTASTV